MVDTEAGRKDRPPPHTGPSDGLEPGTHRQAASREGSWVQRPPFAQGLPSRQGGAVWGQREVGRSARCPGTPAQSDRHPFSLPQATAALHWGCLCGCREPPHLQFPRPPPSCPGPSCWGCSCPCQLEPWEPQGRVGQEEAPTCARCGGAGGCQNGGVLRQEVRVPSVKGRSGSVCPDPGVMEEVGAGSSGAIGLLSRDVGHLLQQGRQPCVVALGREARACTPGAASTGCCRHRVCVEGRGSWHKTCAALSRVPIPEGCVPLGYGVV